MASFDGAALYSGPPYGAVRRALPLVDGGRMSRVAGWNEYQDRVAEFFLGLGLDAATDVTLQGVRTAHDVDVVVRTDFLGIVITWIVECKSWRTRIPKEKVFVLRQIVDDVGADRGLLMSESGYQKGALEAAKFTNVQLTSLDDLAETMRYHLAMARLRRIHERVQDCAERYWALSKIDRIDHGLRGDWDPGGYWGDRVIITVRACVVFALLDGFPVVYDEVLIPLSTWTHRENVPGPDSLVFDDPDDLVAHLAGKLTELEAKLAKAEGAAGPAS
jgi:restriction system protein